VTPLHGRGRLLGFDLAEVIDESLSRRFERGATRADDRFSETAMEDRKREGYFLDETRPQGPLRLATVGSVDDGKSRDRTIS